MKFDIFLKRLFFIFSVWKKIQMKEIILKTFIEELINFKVIIVKSFLSLIEISKKFFCAL